MMIATLIVVSSVFFNIAASLREKAQRIKLENDVHQLNQAISLYRNSGGSLAELGTGEEVLATLRSRMGDIAATRFVGAGTGSLIDERIRIEPLPADEIPSHLLRAYYDPVSQKFRTTYSKRAGIKRFSLSDESGPVVSAGGRGSVVEYAANGTWIWDYVETPTGTAPPVSDFTPTPGVGTPPVPLPNSPTPASPSGPFPPPATAGSGGSGGIALNLGSGTAEADGGIALNLLSDETAASEGELAVGLLGLKLKLGGEAGSNSSTSPSNGSQTGTGTQSTTGSADITLSENAILANLGEGEASGSDALSGNLGPGESSAVEGVSLNGGQGSSTANQGVSGNLGTGTSSANRGIGLNLGSGSASAGSP